MKKHFVVIGGGVAGTAAAHELVERGHQVTIIEKNDRLGGRVYSEIVNDVALEMGAVFLTNFYKNVLSFVRQNNLTDKLYERRSHNYVMKNSQRILLSKWTIAIGTSWVSVAAKMRLLWAVLGIIPLWSRFNIHNIWRASRFDTKSVADLFKDRAGKELIDYAIEPLLNGYLYWSVARTSNAMLLTLLKAGLLQRHTYILRNGGLKQIPEAAAHGSDILLGHEVTHIKQTKDKTYTLTVRGPKTTQTLQADGIVCATTANVVTQLFDHLSPVQKQFFDGITYSSTVVAAYRVPHNQGVKSYAVSYPAKDDSPITAVTVSSDVSPKATLVKIYASGVQGAKLCKLSDKAIDKLFAAHTDVDVSEAIQSGERRIQRWPQAIPEFNVGYLKRLRTFVEGGIENPEDNLVFAGDYLAGPFVEGAFTSGVQAAARLDQQLR